MAFNQPKTAQMAAWLLSKCWAQQAEILKLMKLLYLAERSSLIKFGAPMTGDRLVSMPHGPVLSTTYDVIQGGTSSSENGWDHWMSAREGRVIALRADRNADRENLDELSDADIEVLEEVWRTYGRMSAWQLREFTHANCPEWDDPNGSSKSISLEHFFRSVGKDAATARELAEDICADEEVEKIFARFG